MKKIRINELARELEVKPGVILDLLPELGVQEKKTHSSSIDEDVALVLRHRLTGSDTPRSTFSEGFNGHGHESADGHESSSVAVAEPPAAAEPEPAHPRTPAPPPVRDLAPRAPQPPPATASPVQAAETAEAAAASTPSLPAEAAVPSSSAEAPRPAPFRPLRPPLGGGTALHPPLAHSGQTAGGGAGNRNISIPARPVHPSPPRTGPSFATPAPVGPRQPLPPEPPRVITVPERSARSGETPGTP